MRLPLQLFSVTKIQDLYDYHESSPILDYYIGEKIKIKNCEDKLEHLIDKSFSL